MEEEERRNEEANGEDDPALTVVGSSPTERLKRAL